MITLEIPVKTVSLTNAREPWRARHGRAKRQREATWAVWIAAPFARREPIARRIERDGAVTVTLTRLAPGELDDDNLPPSLKSIRDEIAACLGCDDRDPRITWRYQQQRTKRGDYRVRVEVEE